MTNPANTSASMVPLVTPQPLLRRVSLTGADDLTDISRLEELTHAHPNVEWALLYTPHKEGAPRNPTRAWREKFMSRLAHCSAVHLCGGLAFEQLLAGTLPADVLQAQRLQLNINARGPDFTDAEVLRAYAIAAELGPDVILQYHPGTAALIEKFLREAPRNQLNKLHVLMDASRGKGAKPQGWYRPSLVDESVYVGYAGGIDPENVIEVVDTVGLLGQPYWIDMESGIRTDNQFDIQKATLVLERAGRISKNAEQEARSFHQAGDLPALLDYVLQDNLHNRLTPRVIDIAHTAFMQAQLPNAEDGGASDWFNDVRPVVDASIAKLRKDLFAAMSSESAKNLVGGNRALVSKDAAREALDSLDDFARMEVSVDAKGPRGLLERFIAQTGPVTASDLEARFGEKVVLHPVEQVERWAEALASEPRVGTINGALVVQMLRSYAKLLKATTVA